MSRLTRRDFLKISGGATAAKYLRMWSGGAVEVFLIERNAEFISCPTSNLVLGGTRTMGDITRSYARLRDYGVQVIRDEATAIDVEKKRVSLKRIEDLPYDRLVVSPAVDFKHGQIWGYNLEAKQMIVHACRARTHTIALRQQIEVMPDSWVYI